MSIESNKGRAVFYKVIEVTHKIVEFGRIPIALVVIIFVARFVYIMMHDRCVIENQLNEPIAKLEVLFKERGNEQHRLVFTDVPANGRDWQFYDPKWGTNDSIRILVIKGVTASGKNVGSKNSVSAPYHVDMGIGSTFTLVVKPDRKVKVPSY